MTTFERQLLRAIAAALSCPDPARGIETLELLVGRAIVKKVSPGRKWLDGVAAEWRIMRARVDPPRSPLDDLDAYLRG